MLLDMFRLWADNYFVMDETKHYNNIITNPPIDTTTTTTLGASCFLFQVPNNVQCQGSERGMLLLAEFCRNSISSPCGLAVRISHNTNSRHPGSSYSFQCCTFLQNAKPSIIFRFIHFNGRLWIILIVWTNSQFYRPRHRRWSLISVTIRTQIFAIQFRSAAIIIGYILGGLTIIKTIRGLSLWQSCTRSIRFCNDLKKLKINGIDFNIYEANKKLTTCLIRLRL